MRSPSLAELPPPPNGKSGWPWTEESDRIESHGNGTPYPAVTIVTPSFNQGRFLEQTIRSVLLQGHPNVEYFVLDGGSTDNSIEILEKYSPWISFWTSNRDGGQSAAINRGLRMGSGFYATWINSDDMLFRNALSSFALSGEAAKDDVFHIGDCDIIDEQGATLFTHRGRVHSIEDLLRVPAIWRSGGSIDQPAVLFPRELALRVGGLNPDNHFTMDYELWGRFFIAGAKAQYTQKPFGIFRWHSTQKTQDSLRPTTSLLETAARLASESALPEHKKQQIAADLERYGVAYPQQLWKQSGRLARLGLPPSIVLPLRNAKQGLKRSFTRLRTAK
jgi:hypothetical protein